MIKIWRDGQRLFIDAPVPGEDTARFTRRAKRILSDSRGWIHSIYVSARSAGCRQWHPNAYTGGIHVPRIDATTAEQLRVKLSERVRGRQAIPGSETALRRLVEGIQTGSPPYEAMSSQMGQLIKNRLPLLRPFTEYLGAFRSIEFRGVESAGADQYDVHCERGTSRWRILLAADGQIALASYDWDRPKAAAPRCDKAALSAFCESARQEFN